MNTEALTLLKTALDWQIELGADECIGDEFLDRTLAPPPPTASVAPSRAVAVLKSEPTKKIAEACDTLDALKSAIASHPHPLREGAKNCVFADGNPAARIMIIGEAPGRDEDIQGLPFVGRSGQLLDRMLACIDLNRTAEDADKAVYIANILPWRPSANRTPSVDEAQEFLPFIDRHVALIDPALIVTMGNVSTKTLLGTTIGIMKMRGKWTETQIGGKSRKILPMLHPAYLLRQPQDKRHAWQDLLSLQSTLEGSL